MADHKPRQFTIGKAQRTAVPLLIGIAGPPGAGKTYSGILLATGIAEARGGRVVVLDTERNRALRYAPGPGREADGVNTFDFDHVPFDPPFRSGDFLAAVRQIEASKPAAIVIDSISDEHEGEGGLLSFHDAELDRMAGDDWAKRERVAQAAWIKPKAARLAMLAGFQQTLTPVIFCFRAREKTKQLANDRGKMVPTNIGWTPIAPTEIVHAMDIFALLPIRSDGVPMWRGNTAYEDFSIKLPAAFARVFPDGTALNRDMGRKMALWAMGEGAKAKAAEPAKEEPQSPVDDDVRDSSPQASPGPQGGDTAPPDDGQGGDVAEPQGDLLAGGEGQDIARTEGQAPVMTNANGAEHASDPPKDDPLAGWGDYAQSVAEAVDWPAVVATLEVFTRSQVYKDSDPEMRAKARVIAWRRLLELNEKALATRKPALDFLSDLQAFRCYLEVEVEPGVLDFNWKAFESSDLFRKLADGAKAAFLRAYQARAAFLTQAAAEDRFQ